MCIRDRSISFSHLFVKRYEMLKINFILHIAISEKQCYNSYIPKKEVVSMKDKELRKMIGSRVKQRRLELILTQPYVAEKMGVTASTSLRYENGSIDVYKRQSLSI